MYGPQSLKSSGLLVSDVRIVTKLISSQIERTIKFSLHCGLILRLQEIKVFNNLPKFEDSNIDLITYCIVRVVIILELKICK